jgi:hypothetical protein
MNQSVKRSWRILSAAIITISGIGLLYGLAAVLTGKDSLAVIFIPLVIIPSAIPLILGIFMWRGHRWALIGLRATLILILAGGAFLDLAVGLNVFSFALFAVPFIAFCVVWLILSFK